MCLAANLDQLRKLLGAQRAFDFLLPLKGDPLDECLRPKRSHSPNFDQFVRFKPGNNVTGCNRLSLIHTPALTGNHQSRWKNQQGAPACGNRPGFTGISRERACSFAHPIWLKVENVNGSLHPFNWSRTLARRIPFQSATVAKFSTGGKPSLGGLKRRY